MSTVLITGGTGIIGTALTKALAARGYHVIILTRKIKTGQQVHPNISYAVWDVNKQMIDEDAIRKADYVVHLAGANVAEGRWTDKRKKEIIDSRVKSGGLLVKALKETPNNVKAIISSAAIGYYGPDQEPDHSKAFTEIDYPSKDFLATVVQNWETAIEPVKDLGKRLVILRIGIVLSNDGGAYAEFKKPLKFRIASILGSGKQIVSWIHITDLIRLFIEAIENEHLNGVYNAVAPAPVSNSYLIKTMGAAFDKRYICIHVPGFVLKTMLGEMSVEVLKSTTVSAAKIQGEGFQFSFPDIESAVENLVGLEKEHD